MPESRPKFTVEQQVAHMRASGIRFELFPEDEARRFLESRNFFFKVKAYDNNFDKYADPGHPDFGRYVDLDFGYLVELSRLDHALRYAVMPATLDIEHFLKVQLNCAVSADAQVDGYDIVEGHLAAIAARKAATIGKGLSTSTIDSLAHRVTAAFEAARLLHESGDSTSAAAELDSARNAIEALIDGADLHHAEKSISRLADSSYSRKLAAKYGPSGAPGNGDASGGAGMPFWAFLELASFGDIIGLYKHYFIDLRGGADPTARRVKPLLFPAKALRNAAAHNSCLLHDLRGRMAKPVGRIASLMKGELGMNPDLVARTRRVPAVHDLGALLLTYDAVVPECGTKQAHRERLAGLAGMYREHLDWFAKQPEVRDCLAMMAALFEALAREDAPVD